MLPVLLSLPSLAVENKKKKGNPQTWNQNGNSARRCHLLTCNSELSMGILGGSKGTFNEQALYWSVDKTVVNYVRGWAFNWGSETRSLLAKGMHGQEWGAFDWVLCHWGKGWATTVTQPYLWFFLSPSCTCVFVLLCLSPPLPFFVFQSGTLAVLFHSPFVSKLGGNALHLLNFLNSVNFCHLFSPVCLVHA